jgi:hypothetical protein
MPGPDEVDRIDGAFSLMFMLGAALVFAALAVVRPSPLGRRGRYLLLIEGALIAGAAGWSAAIIADPGLSDSNNPLMVAGDSGWPLHQAFMLVAGIAAWRGGNWPAPVRYTVFGPAIGLALLGAGAILGIDVLAAAGIGSGWAIVAGGIYAVTRQRGAAHARELRPVAA